MKQKIKFVKRFMSVVVAATMVFAMVTGIGDFFPNIKSEAAARQTLYICDIKSGGFSANYAGYTRLSIDGNAGNVNRGCGKGSNDYIWVKTTTDPAQAYTRIWSVWQSDAGTSSSLDGYSVERKTGDLNDGVGSKSGYIYVYATKDRNAGDPISSFGIWNTDDRKLQYAGGNSGSGLTSEYQQEVDSNWNKIDGDLNKNAGGAYIYLYCKRAPYVIPNDIRITFDGEYHRGYVESKTSGVSISYDNTGMYQVGSNTTKYAVSKSGMETAYGTFTNTIADPYGYDKYTKLEDGLWLGVKSTAETATKDDYSYSETDGLTIKSDKEMILFGTKSGKVMKGQIKAAGDIDVNLAIRSLTITRNTQGAAITVNPAEGKTVTITAYGTNNLTSSGAYAAIQKNGSGKLVLTSTTKGTINATAGNNATYGAAGIGSQYNMPVDGIRISENADVTAIGANGAAGIGSGANADAANIEIAGGIVNATAGSGTIGSKNIGGAGLNSETRDINIIGEVVETKGKLIVIAANGPAIGAYAGDVKNVNVLTDATVNLSAENGIAVGALNGSSASDITIIGDNICGAKAEDVPVLGTVSNSVLFVGKTYEVYGTATIRKSTHIKAGTTLELPSSSKLIIPKDVELVVDPQHDDVLPGALVWAADSDAQLIINGTLTVKGTMAMDSEYGIIVLNGSLNLEENANIYGKFFMNGKYTGNGVITKGKNQTPEEGEIAVYLELDIDDGVTYNAKGNLAENQLIIDESSLEDTTTGTYAINNIVAHDGFQITDILLDGKSIINDSSYVTKNQETGEYNVVLSVSEYRGETIKFAVKAKSTVESISIERFPNKTAFAKGAEFDLNGLKVVKTYKNKKTAPVDIDKELKVTGYDMNSVSAQTVTLQYIADDRYSDDITASYEITVFDFAGLNKEKTTLTAGGESFVATDVDNAEHVVKFALGKNVGDISALKDKIRLQVQGFTNSVGQIDFVSSEVVGQNAVEATYVADIYVDKAKTVVIQYTIVITQPTLYYDLAEAAVAVNGEYTYDGTQQTPDKENIEVTIDGAVVPDDQYTVEYGENVNAGTGRLTIKGDGIHTTNSKEETFTIAKAKLKNIDALVRSNEFTVQNDVKHELQIEFGEIEGLAADEYTVSYKKISDQSNIVANVSNGVITTAYDTSYSKAGTAEIAVNVTIKDSAVNYYADSELSHSINVTLTKYVKGTNITITSDSDDFAWDASAGEYKVTLYKGEKIWIDAKLNDGSTDVIDYKVAEGGKEIAACDGITISALGKGSTIITASTGKGATTKRIAVTVLPTTRLELIGTETYEKVFGDSAFTLDVALKDTALESKLSALRYVSADPEVAAVDETGKVTITGCGETTITVTSYTEERAYTSDEYVVIIKVKAPHTKHIKDNGTRVEPTCEKNGSITYRCTECNEVMDIEELKATGHTWDKGKVTTQPTTKTEGVKTYTCSVCKKTKTESIAKLEEPTPVKPTPEKPIVKPIRKGDVVSDDSKAAKVQVISTSKKTVAYKAPVNKKAKTVSIPATVKIRGKKYKVTQIAEGAFKNNKKVTKVTIGSNVSKISKNAFSGAAKLKTITIGKNVTEIGANAFKGCKVLTGITLPAKTTKIGDQAFSGCKKLKTITIKSSKITSKKLSKNAFKGITKVTTIKVPKKKVSSYQKLFKSKGLSSKVKVTK